jgi:hypothetical protein
LSGDPRELYEKIYCQRGGADPALRSRYAGRSTRNRIKEQQLPLFAGRTSCHDFLANQFRVLLSAAAYVLMETLRRVGLAGTELAQAQVDTIRLKLRKIGARVVRSVRRIVPGYGRLRPDESWTSTPPTIPSTGSRKGASFTAITMNTASCRCTSFAATSSWRPTFARPTPTGTATLGTDSGPPPSTTT